MARYHAKQAVIYMSTSGSGAATVLTGASWDLDLSTDLVEVTSFGDANKTFVQGLKNLQGNISGFWDDTDATFFAGTDSSDGVKIYLYPSSLTPGKYWYGTAWLSGGVKADVKGAVTFTGKFSAKSSWGRIGI